MVEDAPEIAPAAVAAFCRSAAAGACFANWSPETLGDYLAFHRAQQTLFVEVRSAECGVRSDVQTSGLPVVVGLAVAWVCRRSEIWHLFEAALRAGHVFRWQPHCPAGEMIFVAEVAAVDRAARAALLRQMAARLPDWKWKPVWTFRRGIIHRLQNRMIGKLLLA